MPTPVQTQTIRSNPGAAPTGVLEAVASGSLLVALVSYFSTNSNGAITVSDSRSNTWTTVEEQGTGDSRLAIAYAQNAAAGDTTVTVTSSGTGDQYISAIAQEYSGMLTTGVFDVDIGATGTGTAASTGNTATPAQATNLVVYVFGTSADAAIPAGAASGYTALDIITSNATFQPISSGWKDIAAAAAQSAALTLGSSVTWVGACAVFKKTVGGTTDTAASLAAAATLGSAGFSIASSAFSDQAVATFGLSATSYLSTALSVITTSSLIAASGTTWRVPTNAPVSTAVHVIVFSGASPTYTILAQGTSTVDSNGYASIASASAAGTKALAVVHNYNDNTATTSIYGGPGIATVQ